MAIEIKNGFGVEQATHDLMKAKELEKIAEKVKDSELGSITINVGSVNVQLVGQENVSDDIPKGELISFLCAQAARHRQSANEWLEFALTEEDS
jgi:hypothetical protein